MLEILRIITQSPKILKHSIIFLFNGAEENILQVYLISNLEGTSLLISSRAMISYSAHNVFCRRLMAL